MLFSRKGKQASRNSSRRFFADRLLPKPYVAWADGIFSRNFTGFGKERENVSVERRLTQDKALPFSHRLCANFSQFFSQIAFPKTLVFTGFETLFLTISQFLWRRENFGDCCCLLQAKKESYSPQNSCSFFLPISPLWGSPRSLH